MKGHYAFLLFLLVFTAMVFSGCNPQPVEAIPAETPDAPAGQALAVNSPVHKTEATAMPAPNETLTSATITYSLETQVLDGRMVFVGIGGEIDGVVNPDLVVQPGVTVRATLVNGDGIPHDLSFPDFNARSGLVIARGKSTEVSFTVEANQAGTYPYFCTQPGHRKAGQEGRLIVGEP